MYRAKIRPLIDAVDQLRGILTNESNIKLPSIVVVGDQSSGKSSVLEALSGVALPRGRYNRAEAKRGRGGVEREGTPCIITCMDSLPIHSMTPHFHVKFPGD